MVVISDSEIKHVLILAMSTRHILDLLAVQGIHSVDLEDDCHVRVVTGDFDPLDDATSYVVLTSLEVFDSY